MKDDTPAAARFVFRFEIDCPLSSSPEEAAVEGVRAMREIFRPPWLPVSVEVDNTETGELTIHMVRLVKSKTKSVLAATRQDLDPAIFGNED